MSGLSCDHHQFAQIAQVTQIWNWGLPLSIFAAGVAGSLHCAGMCSGLIGAMTEGTKSRWAFHAGRGIAYVLLGALAGAFGSVIFGSQSQFALESMGSIGSLLSTLGAVFFALSLVFMGLRVLRNGAHFSWPSPIAGLMTRVYSRFVQPGRSGLTVPLLSGLALPLLPCGWLYAFVIGAASTGSAFRGAVSMAAFFCATIPALELTVSGVRSLLRPLAQRMPRLPGMILIGAGFLTLCLKLAPRFF